MDVSVYVRQNELTSPSALPSQPQQKSTAHFMRKQQQSLRKFIIHSRASTFLQIYSFLQEGDEGDAEQRDPHRRGLLQMG